MRLVPSSELIEEATKRADSLREAMLYVDDYDGGEHTDAGKIILTDASITVAEWAVAGERKGYDNETISELVDLHNQTLDFMDDPEGVETDDMLDLYSTYYAKLASHVIMLIHKERTELSGEDDPMYM